MNESDRTTDCRLGDAAAFVDGELGGEALERFESHLESCAACVDEVRTEKQLLCTLDAAFNDSRSFDLPHDFSRVVTARAESDLRGVRRKHERRRAFQLCVLLAVVSFGLMGAAARGLVIDPLKSFVRVIGTLLDFAGRAAFDLAESTAVLIRVMARAILFAPYGIGIVFLLTLLFSILVLPFLIARYHRTEIIE